MGIEPNHDENYRFSFNKRNSIIIFLYFIDVSSAWLFFFRVANNIKEYMDFFYVFILIDFIFVSYVTTIFSDSKLNHFLESCDSFFDDRE